MLIGCITHVFLDDMQKVLTIAGMHRSGTSLTAMWLHGCGLNLGENLMSVQFDNPLGHFEDLDILNIHQNDLKRKGLKTHGLNLNRVGEFHFEDKSKFEAEVFLKKKSKLNEWGWKEPRSTLYLNEWKDLIPELKVLAVFRPYSEVVNSLIKRTRHSFIKTNKYSLLNRAAHLALFPIYLKMERKRCLDAWMKYNHAILEFHNNHPNDIIIIGLADLITSDQALLNTLNKQFELNLNMKSIKLFYKKELLSRNATKIKSTVNKREQQALKLQNQLERLSIINH